MLPQNRRLSRRDLNKCNLSGKVMRFPNFWLKFIPNDLEHGRFAIVTSTKLSKSAVVRNKLRRDIYRNINKNFSNFDIIFFPQKSMLNLDSENINSGINKALLEIF